MAGERQRGWRGAAFVEMATAFWSYGIVDDAVGIVLGAPVADEAGFDQVARDEALAMSTSAGPGRDAVAG